MKEEYREILLIFCFILAFAFIMVTISSLTGWGNPAQVHL